jgi:CIC family chloride channel protein
MPVSRLAGEIIRTGRHGFPVVDPDGMLFGVVSLEDYRNLIERSPDGAESTTAGEIASTDLVTISPDDSVGRALQRMAPRDLSRLPVVAADNPRRLLGVVRRNDIVRAYEVGVTRREEMRNRSDVARKIGHAAAEFFDFTILPRTEVLGKRIAELDLPRNAVLVSIRRGRDLVIPRGDNVLKENDVVTAICEKNSLEALRTLFAAERNGDSPTAADPE